IPRESAQTAVDLGCGPGNSTEVLAERFPQARVTGLDSSTDMLGEARQRLAAVEFIQADIGDWKPAQTYDVILANASLQWVPDHAQLYPRLVSLLNPGGALAVQTPDNLDEPAHRLAREIAASPQWADRIGDVRHPDRHPAPRASSGGGVVQGLGPAALSAKARSGRAAGFPRHVSACDQPGLSAARRRHRAVAIPAAVYRGDPLTGSIRRACSEARGPGQSIDINSMLDMNAAPRCTRAMPHAWAPARLRKSSAHQWTSSPRASGPALITSTTLRKRCSSSWTGRARCASPDTCCPFRRRRVGRGFHRRDDRGWRRLADDAHSSVVRHQSRHCCGHRPARTGSGVDAVVSEQSAHGAGRHEPGHQAGFGRGAAADRAGHFLQKALACLRSTPRRGSLSNERQAPERADRSNRRHPRHHGCADIYRRWCAGHRGAVPALSHGQHGLVDAGLSADGLAARHLHGQPLDGAHTRCRPAPVSCADAAGDRALARFIDRGHVQHLAIGAGDRIGLAVHERVNDVRTPFDRDQIDLGDLAGFDVFAELVQIHYGTLICPRAFAVP
nr:hypothetical protein [Tanacetum cinerariifolium]